MSNSVFPVLPGLKWDVAKIPRFSTNIHEMTSGKERRAAFWSYPRWEFHLSYEMLRDDVTAELRTLMGFFLQMKGRFDTFLYQDPTDYTVAGQPLGTGNGATAKYQLVRTLGGFVEPMKAIQGSPTIKLNGVTTSGWTMDSSGVITFSAAPGNGVVITADFSYYFRCRFTKDEAEFNQFMKDLWELKKCEFISIK